MKKLSLLLFLLVGSLSIVVAQRTVTGVITDEGGLALIGANVLVKGTTVGTITDIDGSFSLSVPDDAEMLEVTYTGFQTQEILLTGQSSYMVTMTEGTLLSEAVIVGYGERNEINNVQSVSTLSSDNIESIVAISPQQALQGQVSGVQMTNSSGVLGAASSIRIRGVSSITGGTQPLYVIDGVPLNTGDNYSSGYGGASTLNPLLDISAADIESYSVLKDASAVAIYGSRGANGVILINTKKGKAGQNKIGVNLSTGWLTPTKTYDMANSEEFAQIRGDEPSDVYFDWVDNVLQTGRTYDAGVNFSGGNDRTTYYLGGNFIEQSNYSIGNDINRLSGRMNFNHAVSDKLRVGANVNISKVVSDRTSVENSTFAPLTSAYLQQPFVDAFNEDGTYANTGFIANVIAIEDLGLVEFTQRRTTGNVFLKYNLMDNLTFKTDFGMDNIQSEEEFREVEAFTPGGSASSETNTDFKWLTTNTLAYNADFDNSALRVQVGQSYETSQFNNIAVAATGFAADALRNVGSGSTPNVTTASRSEWALASYFASANYNIANKYTVEGTLRRDGSSRFGANNRWGNFWSVGANWILSNEDFLADNGFINFLKLRASYGTTGNQDIANFASRGLYGGGPDSDYDGNPGLRPVQAANPDLKWEQTAQFDVGFETRFIDNKYSLGVSIYNKNTTDLLLPFQVEAASGFTSITRNAGEMANRGVDIDFGARLIEKEDFSWNMNFNISYLENEIISLPDAAVDDEGRRFISGSANQRAIEGLSANEFFLIEYNGVNSETGDAEWLTADGELTTMPSATDRVLNGSAIPSWTGGLSTSLRYKDFDFTALLSFVTGSRIYIGELRFTENPLSGFNKSRDLLDAWQQPGDNTFAPSPDSPTYGSFAQRSTLQLFKGDFARLRNVELGYTLRGEKIGVSGLGNTRVYLRANNLLTFVADDFRGQDPEISADGAAPLVQGESFFAMPQARIVQVGLSASF